MTLSVALPVRVVHSYSAPGSQHSRPVEASGRLGHLGTAGLCFRLVFFSSHTCTSFLLYLSLSLVPRSFPAPVFDCLQKQTHPTSFSTLFFFSLPLHLPLTPRFLFPPQLPPLPPAILLSLTSPTQPLSLLPSLVGARGHASTAHSSTHLTSLSVTPATSHEHTSTTLSLSLSCVALTTYHVVIECVNQVLYLTVT